MGTLTSEIGLESFTDFISRNYPFPGDFSSPQTRAFSVSEAGRVLAVWVARIQGKTWRVEALAVDHSSELSFVTDALAQQAIEAGTDRLRVQYAPYLEEAFSGLGFVPGQVKRLMCKLSGNIERPSQDILDLETASDSELADLWNAAYTARTPKIQPMTAEEFREFFLADETEPYIPEASGVIRVDGTLAGFIIAQHNSANAAARRYIPDFSAERASWISEVVVSPHHRRKGYGKALVRHALSKLGLPVYLLVDIDNLRAEQLYASLGFSRVGEPARIGLLNLSNHASSPL